MKKTILPLIAASTLFLSMNSIAMEFLSSGAYIADTIFTGIRYNEMATDVERSRAPLIVNLLNSKLDEINALLANRKEPYKIVDFRLEDYGYKDWKHIVSYSVSTVDIPTVNANPETGKWTSLKKGDPYWDGTGLGGFYFVAPDGSGVVLTGVSKQQNCDSPASPPDIKKIYCK